MLENDYPVISAKLSDIAKRHNYTLDACVRKFNIIDGDAPVHVIRRMLNNLLADHHYEITGFFAEYMLKDQRKTVQALGRSTLKKVANAPADPPALLRMKDRIEKGLFAYKCDSVWINPWLRDKPQERQFVVHARNEDDAIKQAKIHLAVGGVIPEIISLKVALLAG